MLGIGSEKGAPVPLATGGLLKDRSGNIMIPGVDHDALARLALAGGGRHLRMTPNNADIAILNRNGLTEKDVFPGVSADQGLKGDAWEDRGRWLLLPVLMMAALAFRRGWLLVFILAASPLVPPSGGNGVAAVLVSGGSTRRQGDGSRRTEGGSR